MRTIQIKNIAAFLLIIAATLFSISCKKSDPIGDSGSSDLYTVPVTMTLDGVKENSTITVRYGFGNHNCQVQAMQAYAESPNFTVTLNNFAKAGSSFNGALHACDKPTIEVYKGTSANGIECNSKESSPETLSLSGNTYTLSSTVHGETNNNGMNQQVSYVLTATWTRP